MLWGEWEIEVKDFRDGSSGGGVFGREFVPTAAGKPLPYGHGSDMVTALILFVVGRRASVWACVDYEGNAWANPKGLVHGSGAPCLIRVHRR